MIMTQRNVFQELKKTRVQLVNLKWYFIFNKQWLVQKIYEIIAKLNLL